MANTCTNKFFATIKVENTDPKHEEIYKKINDFLADNFMGVDYSEYDECCIETEFDSKWTFPYDTMEKLTKQLQKEYPNECKDLYIRCLSFEFGCEYVDYMVYRNGEWHSKIAMEN